MLNPLQTSRLVVRRFESGDRDAVMQLESCGGTATRDGWLDWCVRNYSALQQMWQPPYGDYAVTLPGSGEIVGAVGLVPCLAPFEKLPFFRARMKRRCSGLFSPEVGLFWAINTPHRKSGYAAEAAAALADFAFQQMHVDRLVATTTDDNEASIAVMKKLGMIIWRNPDPQPVWFQVVGVLPHPKSCEAAAITLH